MTDRETLEERVRALTEERDALLSYVRAVHEAMKLGPVLSEAVIREALEYADR